MCRGCVTQCAESVPKISPFASHPHRSPVPASPCRKGSHIIYTPTSTLSPPHILSALRAFAETSSHFPANARILRVGRVCNTHTHTRACVCQFRCVLRSALCSLASASVSENQRRRQCGRVIGVVMVRAQFWVLLRSSSSWSCVVASRRCSV